MTSWSTATLRSSTSARHFAASSRFAPTATGMSWTAASSQCSCASRWSARRCDSMVVARRVRSRRARLVERGIRAPLERPQGVARVARGAHEDLRGLLRREGRFEPQMLDELLVQIHGRVIGTAPRIFSARARLRATRSPGRRRRSRRRARGSSDAGCGGRRGRPTSTTSAELDLERRGAPVVEVARHRRARDHEHRDRDDRALAEAPRDGAQRLPVGRLGPPERRHDRRREHELPADEERHREQVQPPHCLPHAR